PAGKPAITPKVTGRTGKKAIALPNSSEKQTAGQHTTRLAGITREISASAQCSRAAFAPNETAMAKTPKTVNVPVSPRSTGTPTRLTRSQLTGKTTVARNLRREIQTTEQQAMGSADAQTAKPVPRKPTPSQRSHPKDKPKAVPNKTAKQPSAEQESGNVTEPTKHNPTRFSSVASRATRSTRKIDGVNKAWR
ncbi:hypothetical protein AAF712_012138, partial [Marasmius tenuissimus]